MDQAQRVSTLSSPQVTWTVVTNPEDSMASLGTCPVARTRCFESAAKARSMRGSASCSCNLPYIQWRLVAIAQTHNRCTNSALQVIKSNDSRPSSTGTKQLKTGQRMVFSVLGFNTTVVLDDIHQQSAQPYWGVLLGNCLDIPFRHRALHLFTGSDTAKTPTLNPPEIIRPQPTRLHPWKGVRVPAM